ncbi:MAG: MFS transporter, partial [Pseudomonadota bacterium]
MPAPASALGFVGANARWLGAGTLLSMSSAFGQTFFISLFNDDIRATFSLSNGGFGTVYAVATLASAATLIPLGRVADRPDIARVVGVAIVCLGLTALGMAALPALAHTGWLAIGLLVVVIYALRLFGQGLMTHLAMTLMAKWFSRNRGRAIAIAALGLPLSEATFPGLSVRLGEAIGWRGVWLLGGLALILVIAPLVAFAVSKLREPSAMEDAPGPAFGL